MSKYIILLLRVDDDKVIKRYEIYGRLAAQRLEREIIKEVGYDEYYTQLCSLDAS